LKKFWLILLVAAVSCNTIDVFEKTKMFPSHNWKESDTPSFTFDISDTTSLYNIFLVIRHQDAYRYNNIWVVVTMAGPSDTLQVKREFILANNIQGWLGSGMDDIFEHRIAFNQKPAALKKGTYTFTLQQAMREDPLEYVMNVGIRVERAK
jgi:gliding motility-associated lipoprotein GldH